MIRKNSSSASAQGITVLRTLPKLIALLLMIGIAYSCSETSEGGMGNVNTETFPTMLTTNVSTLVSDSGYTRYHLTTDTWLMFDEATDPYWSFPTGLFMERYNDSMHVESTFRADSATYLSKQKLWQFDRNVRMNNVNGDRFVTEQLFWDQQTQKVYSDSFIHIERTDRILEGYGFISNEEMTEYTIMTVSGIFPTPRNNQREHSANTSDSITYPHGDSIDANNDTIATTHIPSRRHRVSSNRINR